MICNAQETIGRSPSARNKEEKKMVTNDATILRLKHDVLYEVAKAAWEGNLDEKREQIP